MCHECSSSSLIKQYSWEQKETMKQCIGEEYGVTKWVEYLVVNCRTCNVILAGQF
jgi:hypothetical protein